MKRLAGILFSAALLCGCASDVGQKVKYDFGIGEKPEDYVTVSDKIMGQLPEVGAMEMQRMNTAARHGEVLYEEETEFRGKFFKQVKIYERAVPLEAKATPTSSANRGTRSFVGYIDYAYRIYQGPRRDTRAEARADDAIISTGESGRETYRYNFGAGGDWNGGKGERVRD